MVGGKPRWLYAVHILLCISFIIAACFLAGLAGRGERSAGPFPCPLAKRSSVVNRSLRISPFFLRWAERKYDNGFDFLSISNDL